MIFYQKIFKYIIKYSMAVIENGDEKTKHSFESAWATSKDAAERHILHKIPEAKIEDILVVDCEELIVGRNDT